MRLIILLLSIFLLTGCTSKKEKLENAIYDYYMKANSSSGGGSSSITNVEILKIENDWVKAYIQGYYTNESTPKPQEGDISDTLNFKFDRRNSRFEIISVRQ